jgi:predicted Zn-dependent protease
MSEEQEIAMGKEADPQIVAQYGLYADSSLQKYISTIGENMADISHRPKLNYEFKILDSEILNAFAVPGGYVYFTRGIMAYFNNEAEFAGVLGHEIGHIAARHSVSQQRNMILGQLGIIAGAVISPEFGRYAETASQGLGLLFLKFGRDAERESDKLGVEYSSKLKYDAQEMAGFFNTLERKQEESGNAALPSFLSTHPNPGDRFTDVNKLAAEWKKKLNLTSTNVERNNYLKKIDGIIYGADPKQGYVENNVFYHPELKFQFPLPAQWNYQNSPQSFQMAPKDGKAMMVLSLAAGNSLDEAATSMLQRYQLQAVDSRAVSVNGLNGLQVVADQAAQGQSPSVRTLSYFIKYDSRIYHILGVTDLANYNSYYPAFLSTMQNFKILTDASKINKKAERIQVKTVRSNTTLQQALKSFNVPDKRLEELALLNGMQLTDNVTSGMLIKTVGQ